MSGRTGWALRMVTGAALVLLLALETLGVVSTVRRWRQERLESAAAGSER